ncbi:DUF4271 domain-containing protein [Lacinutrix iliipiscaria]|uniref:DUF4271 domain-containing protein n=1 Tax=Lacinutrix iliipiscaria TaxID=1230532 RepID=A0ABW5WJD6_9FLAO
MLRPIVFNEIFTILLVICLVLIALAKVFFPKRFNDFIYVLGNFRYLKVYARDQKFIDGFDALLFTNLLVSGSIFGYLIYKSFVGEAEDVYTLLIKLFVGIGVFILGKILIERLIGSLFNIDALIDVYVFQKMSYKNFLGLLLIPINAVLIYRNVPTENILQILIVIFLLVNGIGLASSFKTYQSLIKSNLFYFILYLCALEISPYVILYKLAIDA